MIILPAKIRKDLGSKVKALRQKELLPAILYGPEIKAVPIEINTKEFKKVYQEAGESSLIELKGIEKKEPLVLIYEVKRDPLTLEPIHVDFYQPILTKEVEATVPLVFEGEAPAVKEKEGTLVKEIQEIEVKALPQKLPHEIRVNVECLETFEDEITVKDLSIPQDVTIDKDQDALVAHVTAPEKVAEELEKPIEEKPDEVERVEKEEKEVEVPEKKEKGKPEPEKKPEK